jgi:DnaJ like chaperone protein
MVGFITIFIITVFIHSSVFAKNDISAEVKKMLGTEVTITKHPKKKLIRNKPTKNSVIITQKRPIVTKITNKRKSKKSNKKLFYFVIGALILYGFYQITSTLRYLNRFKKTKKSKIQETEPIGRGNKTKQDTDNIDDSKRQPIGRENERKSDYIGSDEAIIAIYTKLAKSKGHISKYAADKIIGLIDFFETNYCKNFGVDSSKAYRKKLVNMHNISKKENDKSIEFYVKIAKQGIKNDYIEEVFSDMVNFAKNDTFSKQQEALLYIIGKHFSLNEKRIEEFIGHSTKQNEKTSKQKNPYEILGCTPDDDCNTIKSKYRKLIQGVHPDKINSKELDEQIKNFAENRTKELNAAYEEIRKIKNCS